MSLKVAVLAGLRKTFDRWVQDYGLPGVEYHCVQSARDVMGLCFSGIEQTHDFYLREDAYNIKMECSARLCRPRNGESGIE